MPPTVAATFDKFGTKFRAVKDANGQTQHVIEKCMGEDAMEVERWERLGPHSSQQDLWDALQAALSRI